MIMKREKTRSSLLTQTEETSHDSLEVGEDGQTDD